MDASPVSAVMTYPAPERNKAPILDVLARVLPESGTVLEIASGTGQHVVHFAAALPTLQWQPSDPEAAHLESIAARAHAATLPNIRPPLRLDVRERPWPVSDVAAIVCINMIHIAPWDATLALMDEAGRILGAGGVLYLYGPYLRAGVPTAPGNAAFDADLRRHDPAWGVRSLEAVAEQAAQQGLALQDVVDMPANNLSVVFRRDRNRAVP